MTSLPGQLFKEVGRSGSGIQYMTQIAGDISVIPKIFIAQRKKKIRQGGCREMSKLQRDGELARGGEVCIPSLSELV